MSPAGHRDPAGLANSAAGNYKQRADDALFASLADGPLHLARHLGDIAWPCRILVGDRDKQFRRACEVMAAEIPDAKLAVVEDAGHMVLEKRPESFNAAMLAFLDELNAGLGPSRL